MVLSLLGPVCLYKWQGSCEIERESILTQEKTVEHRIAVSEDTEIPDEVVPPRSSIFATSSNVKPKARKALLKRWINPMTAIIQHGF